VNGLKTESQYEGALQFEVLDATTEESKAKVKEYGFDHHGLVIFDDQNVVKVRMNGHAMTDAEIRAALKDVMGGT
jgi:hypothetical protein